MAYKLVIADRVNVPVKIKIKDGSKFKEFDFDLICKRLDTDELKEKARGGEVLMSEFLKEVTVGWERQKLVVDDEGKPAEFNDESFDMMLKTAGLAVIAYNAYLKECGAKEKN